MIVTAALCVIFVIIFGIKNEKPADETIMFAILSASAGVLIHSAILSIFF